VTDCAKLDTTSLSAVEAKEEALTFCCGGGLRSAGFFPCLFAVFCFTIYVNSSILQYRPKSLPKHLLVVASYLKVFW
jgi:hypothetical protein